MNRQQRFDYLYNRMTDKHFLNRTHLGDELPFYICPYKPREKFMIIEDVQMLKKKLSRRQIKVLEFDLFDMTIDQCKTWGIWEQIKSGVLELTKEQLKETFQNIMAPHQYLKEIIGQRIAQENHDLIFITGVGEVYPYLRTHAILNNLQSMIQDKPVIIFFPGEYKYHPINGSTLELFGRMHNDRFYRAFNIYEH